MKNVDESAENEIIDTVTGFADGFDRVLDEKDMHQDDLEEWLLDRGIEKCPECQWWVESSELLTDESDIDGHCENCRE